MPEKAIKFTVVQHSAYGYSGDVTFRAGLETRQLTGTKEIKAVEKAGGVLFDTYTEAEDFANTAPYPPGYEGIVPQAKGTFHATATVDGLAVYIPVRAVQVVG